MVKTIRKRDGNKGRSSNRRTLPLDAIENRPLVPERAFVVQFRSVSAGSNLFEGRVEHITSGCAARFSAAADLMAFFERTLADAATDR